MSRDLAFSILDPSSPPLHQPHTYINRGESRGGSCEKGHCTEIPQRGSAQRGGLKG